MQFDTNAFVHFTCIAFVASMFIFTVFGRKPRQ